MTAPLASEEVLPRGGARPERWWWFLHGVFGRGRNWRSVARRLVDAVPGTAARLVDLRLHGASTDASPPHTVETCADDLAAVAEAPGVEPPELLLGHSFGGKVALEAAGRPTGLGGGPDVVWMIDVSPAARPPEGDAVRMLEVLRREPGPFADRREAVSTLRSHGFTRPVARWMATNLEEGEGGLRWALDLDGVEELLEDFFRTELWDVLEAPPGDRQFHVVRAERSGALPEETWRRLETAAARSDRVHVHRLAGDHWLNVSNPDGLIELLTGRATR